MTPIDLMTAVVLETGIPLNAIKSKRRHRPIADARKYMALALTMHTRMARWQIADLMGQSRTATHWHVTAATHLMTTDPKFTATMNRIINRLETKAA